ncbi:MAG: Na(+)/H(+) antiporter subunit D [Rhodocyclaceae bacterium]|nr:Na(+)/H(+) antiporter subunit D [Rhodocyclaceae bacterium]
MAAELFQHPGGWLILGGIVLAFVRGTPRAVLSMALPVLALGLLWGIADGVYGGVAFLDFRLDALRVDRLSRLFATVFLLALFVGSIYAMRQQSRIELPAAFVYGGAAIGAVLAGDLLTLFVFWELMAIGSTLVIWAGGREAYPAAMRYLMVHLLGGVVLMAGITGHLAGGGSLRFEAIALDGLPQWLILAGFLINAGAFPLGSWLPDAYPRASWSGMVFLSAFTTKTAVYVLMRGFPGAEILIPIGLFMAGYGLIYALVENGARRVLAYAIINQVGFMVAGIGIGSEMALNGVAAHAFAHIVYKALLLMAIGAVIVQTGKRDCTELGGLARQMPVTCGFAIFGALAMSAPLTAGFITKSLVLQAAADAHLTWVWLGMMVIAAGVFLAAGLKIVVFVFFGAPRDLDAAEAPASQRWGMRLLALMSLAVGCYPPLLYDLLPYAIDYQPYTGSHVVFQLQLLLATAVVFFLMRDRLTQLLGSLRDIDWLYRSLGPRWVKAAVHTGSAKLAEAGGSTLRGLGSVLTGIRRHHGTSGVLARTWPSGSMVLWVAILLLMYLVLYYIV